MTGLVKPIRKKKVHVELHAAAQMKANHMEIARNQEGKQLFIPDIRNVIISTCLLFFSELFTFSVQIISSIKYFGFLFVFCLEPELHLRMNN